LHHFVVTGSGRSGTTYAARLFTALGVECGHEAVFRVDTSRFTGFGPYVGDASWLAVPFVASLPDDVRVTLELLDERRFDNGVVYLRHRILS